MTSTSASTINSRGAINSRAWRAMSLLLILEERICNCGAVHEIPGDLFIRMTIDSPYKEWLVKRTQIEFDGILPHETRRVTSFINACTSCFEADSEGQLNIFGSVEPIEIESPLQHLKNNEKLAILQLQRKATKPKPTTVGFSLEDF